MSTFQRVNAAKLRDAIASRGLSVRQAGIQSGLTPSAIRNMSVDGRLHASTPLARVRSLLDVLGLTWGDLLDDPVPETPADQLRPDDRQRVLARILTTSDRGIALPHLCNVLGTTIAELVSDLDSLKAPFAALGFALIVGNNDKVLLTRGTDPHADHVQARLAVLRDADDDLNISAANTLYRAFHGALAESGMGNNDLVQVTALTKRGALAAPRTGEPAPLSEATIYCLTPDGLPTN